MRGVVVPEAEEDFTADPVELFFDLSYVFAFTRMVYELAHEPTWQHAGTTLLLFVLVWITWTQFTWSANAVPGNQRSTRVWFLLATAAAVPMGASISTAYDAGGWAFAASLVGILGMGLLMMYAGLPRDSPVRHSIALYSVPNVVAMVLLLVGAAVAGDARIGWWVAAFGVVLLGMFRAGGEEWIVRPGHFTERHGLILIIALGEVVVASGLGVAEALNAVGSGEATTPSSVTFVALGAAGTLAGLLWWGYFDRAQVAIEHAAAALAPLQRGPFARDVWSLWHVPIVGGVITVAAAVEEVSLHPADPLPLAYRVMLAIGLASFLLGIVGALHRALDHVVVERAAAGVVLAAAVVLGGMVSGVVLVLLLDAALLVLYVVEGRGARPVAPAPAGRAPVREDA